jgi:hypothetical protein
LVGWLVGWFSVAPGWALVSMYADMFNQISGSQDATLGIALTATAAATQMLGRFVYPLMSKSIGPKTIMVMVLTVEVCSTTPPHHHTTTFDTL